MSTIYATHIYLFIIFFQLKGDIYQDDASRGDLLAENIYYVTMKGESSFEQCSADIKKLFNKKQKCKPNENIDQADSCTFENIFIADVKSSKFLVKLK